MITEINDYFVYLKSFKSPNTVRSYTQSIEKFFDWANIKTIDDINNLSISQCKKYILYLKDEKNLKITTINTHINNLKAVFQKLYQDEQTLNNPFSKIKNLKEPKRKEIFLTLDEARKVMESCKRLEDRVIIGLMLTTGLRRNELVNLKLSDYDGTHINFIGKGDKERKLIITPEIKDILDNYIDERNEKYGNKYDYLFISKSHDYSNEHDGKFSGEAIRLKVKKSMEDAGFSQKRIEEITPHKLRHTFTSFMVLGNAELYEIKNALGHSSIQTTMRYMNIVDPHMDQAMLNQPKIIL